MSDCELEQVDEEEMQVFKWGYLQVKKEGKGERGGEGRGGEGRGGEGRGGEGEVREIGYSNFFFFFLSFSSSPNPSLPLPQANADETFSFTSCERTRHDSLSLYFLIHPFPPPSPSTTSPSTPPSSSDSSPHFAFQSLLTKKYLCAGSRTAVVSRGGGAEGNFKYENGDLFARMKGGRYQWLFFDTKRKVGCFCFGGGGCFVVVLLFCCFVDVG